MHSFAFCVADFLEMCLQFAVNLDGNLASECCPERWGLGFWKSPIACHDKYHDIDILI